MLSDFSLSFFFAPQPPVLFFTPLLSFSVTFPGNKLQGAITLCAKESIKPATISVEDVAQQTAIQKQSMKFIKLPVG